MDFVIVPCDTHTICHRRDMQLSATKRAYHVNNNTLAIFPLSCTLKHLNKIVLIQKILISWSELIAVLLEQLQPFSSYFEKGCRKKCTRQSRMVLWVVFSSLFFKEIWKNGTTRGHGYMSASAEGKQKKSVRQLQCEKQYIDHIPYYLSGLSSAHFSDNLSRNSCIHTSILKAYQNYFNTCMQSIIQPTRADYLQWQACIKSKITDNWIKFKIIHNSCVRYTKQRTQHRRPKLNNMWAHVKNYYIC